MTKEVDLSTVRHGVPSTYNNYGCKCDKCKKAWADYMRQRVRDWRKKKKNANRKRT